MEKSLTYTLPAKLQKLIDANMNNYPSDQKQSAILYALTETQRHEGGWLQDMHIHGLAKHFEMEPIKVYEVAIFYSMIKLSKTANHSINFCTNISCQLVGAGKIVKYIEEYLGVSIGETTEDGKIAFCEAECLAACVNAPMMLVDGQYHENLTKDKVKVILDNLIEKGQQ